MEAGVGRRLCGAVVQVAKVFFAALIVIWTIDVAVHLALFERLVVGRVPPSRLSDYFGLLLVDAQVAFFVAAVSTAAGWCFGALAKSGSRSGESTLMLAGALSAVVVVAGFENYWTPPLGKLELFFIAAGTGVVVWAVLRQRTRVSDGEWSFGRILDYALFPTLLLAFAYRGFAAAYQRDVYASLLSLAVVLVVSWILLRGLERRGRLQRAMRLLPTIVVLAIAYYSTTSLLYDRGEESSEFDPGGAALPNLVLIVLDTVRADHLAAYGYSRETMPQLESWARGALIARRAFSAAGWTSPAHASMFSGWPVSRHGVHYNAEPGSLHTDARPGISWLPQRLSDAGYYCLAVTANPFAITEDVQGFARVISPQREGWDRSTIGARAAALLPWMNRLSERLRWRLPYADAEQIVEIVRRVAPRDRRPVFLFVNFLDAHSPYNPPDVALDLLGLDPPRLYDRHLTHRGLTRALGSLPSQAVETLRDLYDGELRGLDIHLGRLLDWITERYGSETIVIVTADHGEELGEHGRVGHEYGLSQSLLHVPLFIRSSSVAPGEIDEPVTLRSLASFLHRVGTGGRPDLDALTLRDQHGLLAERYPAHFNIEFLGPEYDRAWVALVEGDTKAVGPAKENFEFFEVGDFSVDRPLSRSNPSELADLRARIEAYWTAHRDRRQETTPGSAPSRDELERLRALGYAE